MTQEDILIGVLLEDDALSVDELARACACETRWVLERIESGVLSCTVMRAGEWRFASSDLMRARRLLAMERDFDANPELAALTVDLIEEVEALRRRLRGGGAARGR